MDRTVNLIVLTKLQAPSITSVTLNLTSARQESTVPAQVSQRKNKTKAWRNQRDAAAFINYVRLTETSVLVF